MRVDDEEENKKTKENVFFLVIDRDARRFKKDKEVRGAGFELDRQKIDIANFDLVGYLSMKYPERKEDEESKDRHVGVIGIAKHLCGGATDLALASYDKLEQD